MARDSVSLRRLPRRPKKPRGKGPIRVNTHLPGDLVARIDRYAAKLTAEDKLGRQVTRSEAIRSLIADALDRAGIE